MRASKVFGWVVGVAVLFSAFFLPFWNLTSATSGNLDTLYGALRFTVDDWGSIVQSGFPQVIALGLMVLTGALLVAVSGLLGAFPRGSGALGVLGMMAVSLGPVVLFPSYNLTLSNFGNGYWSIWVLSVLNLLVGAAGRGSSTPQTPTPPPAQPAVIPQTAPPAQL